MLHEPGTDFCFYINYLFLENYLATTVQVSPPIQLLW
jgi:hypothetical protein